MSVSYAASLKATRMQDVINAIDAQASPGSIEICTAEYAQVLATVTLQKPSFTQANGVITMNVPLSDEATSGGAPANARILDGDGNVIVTNLTVTPTGDGGDVQINSDPITEGQTVTVTSGAITHSP